MSMDRPMTKPPFVPPEGFPIRLRPDIINVSTWDQYRFQVWMGPYAQVEGSSDMSGPDGERAAYIDVINQLVNLAYYHYCNWLDEIEYSRDEVKGTSFDDGTA